MERPAGSAKLLRGLNTSAVLSHLLNRGPLTRADIRELTGLSKPTTGDVLRSLVNADLARRHRAHLRGPGTERGDLRHQSGRRLRRRAVGARDRRPPRDLDRRSSTWSAPSVRVPRSLSIWPPTDPAATLANALIELCKESDIPVERVRHTHIAVPGSYDHTTDTIRHVDVPGLDRPGLVTSHASHARRAGRRRQRREPGRHRRAAPRSRRGRRDLRPALARPRPRPGHRPRRARCCAARAAAPARSATCRSACRPTARCATRTTTCDGILAGPAVLALAADHGDRRAPTRTTR